MAKKLSCMASWNIRLLRFINICKYFNILLIEFLIEYFNKIWCIFIRILNVTFFWLSISDFKQLFELLNNMNTSETICILIAELFTIRNTKGR